MLRKFTFLSEKLNKNCFRLHAYQYEILNLPNYTVRSTLMYSKHFACLCAERGDDLDLNYQFISMSVPTWAHLSGRIFKENLRNRLSLTSGCPEVLSMVPFLQILNRWVWPNLFLVSLWRVSLVKTNQWQEAFFWPIAVSDLCCNTGRMHWTEPRPETIVIHKAI